jgi:hypothetical protein
MGIRGTIADGHGTGNSVKVNDEGTIGVVLHNHPPVADPVHLLPFTADFENGGSNDMAVDGTTAVEFEVLASATKDRFVKNMSFELTDTNPQLRLFGALAALSNGVRLLWVTQDSGSVELGNAKTGFELYRIALGLPAFGDDANAFRVANAVAINDDSYMPVIDMTATFGFPWGLRLRKGTTDRLCVVVRDDLSSLTSFTCKAFGTEL